VPQQDRLVDAAFESGKTLAIRDLDWFRVNVNTSPATAQAYMVFVDSSLHKFNLPGTAYEVADLDHDPRVYVFLRQLLDDAPPSSSLNTVLTDALILFALEGTDPAKGILKTRTEILETIKTAISFEPALIEPNIDGRLASLSRKPRRIRHHPARRRTAGGYCLPYETRLEIQNRNVRDRQLYEQYKADTLGHIAEVVPNTQQLIADQVFELFELVVHQIFRDQGLEFAAFYEHADASASIEKFLPDVIAKVVDRETPRVSNRNRLKSDILMLLRHVIYRGTTAQLGFLQRLCRTYAILFLLRCDPRLATYFTTLASKLEVFVDNSILIPAMSEHLLDKEHQRYSNLLRGAHQAGTRLVISQGIVSELAAHFRLVIDNFRLYYEGREDVYDDESALLYVPDIMLRAYFYAKARRQVRTFNAFIKRFVNPEAATQRIEEDVIEWVKAEYGIEFVTDNSLNVHLDRDDLRALTDELSRTKGSDPRARTDARMVLTVYALRERNNEKGDAGIFGYRTWWLSTDTKTAQAVRSVLGSKYPVSCYMRSDFLYHFIALAPSRDSVDRVFSNMFPSLSGVSVSHYVPDSAIESVRSYVAEHTEMSPGRIKARIRELTDELKSVDRTPNSRAVRLFLDEERASLTA
jgi:hypothetical protein